MINPDGVQSTFWRICNDEGVCHCDWRLTLGDCEEDVPMRIIYIINAVLSGLGSAFAVILVAYRVHYRRQQIFDCRTPTGFVRPKPIEAMLFMAIWFNLLRMIQAIIAVTDAAPNPIFRSFIYEFPWQFGIACLTCYVFGIAHTVADSSKRIYNAWFQSPVSIDIIFTGFLLAPFVTNNICSIAAGVYAQRGENHVAAQFTHALYYFWTIYCGSLGFLILVAGIRLLRLLKHHLRMQHDLRVNIAKIKTGVFKVKAIMVVGCLCLWVFAFVLCMYGVFRGPITLNTGLNLAISSVWTYDGAVATLLIETALILNPRMKATLAISGVSSGSRSDPAGQNSSTMATTIDRHNLTFTMETATVTHSVHKWESQPEEESSLPRYSISDISMDILKNGPAHFYYGHESKPREIEQDQLNYNATTGQIRAPPRPPADDYHQRRHGGAAADSFIMGTTNDSTISSAHLIGSHGFASPP